MLHNTPDGSRETPHNENINVSAEKHRSLHYVEFKKKKAKWPQVQSGEVLSPDELGQTSGCRSFLDLGNAGKGCGAIVGVYMCYFHLILTDIQC